MSEYKYSLSSTHDSSAKYGNCEVCNKPASEVFYQVETRKYTNHEGNEGYTQHKCFDYFGHEKCLIEKRR